MEGRRERIDGGTSNRHVWTDIMLEAQETYERIRERVEAIVITDSEGRFRRTTIDNEDEARKYASYVGQLAIKAQNVVRDVDPTNEMTFLRFTLKAREILVAPGNDFFLIVIMNRKKDEEENPDS